MMTQDSNFEKEQHQQQIPITSDDIISYFTSVRPYLVIYFKKNNTRYRTSAEILKIEPVTNLIENSAVNLVKMRLTGWYVWGKGTDSMKTYCTEWYITVDGTFQWISTQYTEYKGRTHENIITDKDRMKQTIHSTRENYSWLSSIREHRDAWPRLDDPSII
jgi:hypothetical protein